MEILEDLSRTATLSSWFVIFTFQGLLLNISRVCTLNIIFIVLCPQTDFEKDVDMACRSGKLQLDCSLTTFDGVFACAFDATSGSALRQLQMSL